MPWFKVDDGFHGHPKVLELSVAAVGIWTLAGSWSAKYLTDGLVTIRSITRMGGDAAMADELVEAGLWVSVDGDYQFKDWADYQPLKSDVEAERAAAQERMRSVRAKKKGVQPNNIRTEGERSDEHFPKFARSSADVRVTPSQSLPSPIPSQSPKVQAAKRGSRIQEDWAPSEALMKWASTDLPGVDVLGETPNFVDYWTAQAGARGIKADWNATWRTWMRRQRNTEAAASKPRVTAAQRNLSTVAYFEQLEQQKGIEA